MFDDFKTILEIDKNKAYKYLYENLNPLIISIICGYTKNIQEVKDLSQNVWIKIYLNIDKFKGGNFTKWVITLCNRICIDKYRRIKTNRQHYNTFNVNDYQFLDNSNFFKSNFSTQNILVTEILNCLNSLDKSKQELFLMKLKGLTYKKISLLTNTNSFTICNQHKAIIVEIVNELEKKGIVKSKKISETKNSYKTPNNYKIYPCI
jgi:RNA polymerase sigma-70 factor (ECF subfamily)